MPKKSCSYPLCRHNGKDYSTVEIVRDKVTGKLFHKDCLHDACNLALIRNIWATRINRNVSYGALSKEMERLIKEEHMDTDYIVFVLEYVIAHKMNLTYPAGLKFYLHKPSIEQAYAEKHKKIIDPYSVQANVPNVEPPKFGAKKQKTGFSKIFGGGK